MCATRELHMCLFLIHFTATISSHDRSACSSDCITVTFTIFDFMCASTAFFLPLPYITERGLLAFYRKENSFPTQMLLLCACTKD